MIGEDRVQLNERFCVAFKMLEDKGIIIKNDRNGKGIGDVAERIMGKRGYGHIVRAFLNGDNERVISYTQARVFCREFGINEDWMLDGSGSPFGLDLKKSFHLEPVERKGNILFTTIEAFAGTAVDASSFTKESAELFSLPGLSGNGLVAFPVNGNSMDPVIHDGDVVVCREIENMTNIRDNEIYAVKSNGSVWIKYVQKILNRAGRVGQLKLISANHLEYDPFTEDVNEYTRLYKVVRKISTV